ncbi:unnamed protein product [Linum trigynum]|uniref:Zinc knuckle CX2CX4HX4C domain-containing protein n=1 Tax=Linum trigynum TaxID=586398 RepID=A0AAV2EPY2_9ROSI
MLLRWSRWNSKPLLKVSRNKWITSDDPLEVEDGDVDVVRMEVVRQMGLIGRLVAEKQPNVKSMKIALAKAWNLKKTFQITNLGDMLFAFQFIEQDDKNKVCFGGPWPYENNPLNLLRTMWDTYMRLRVSISINNPLKKKIKLNIGGRLVEYLVKYEKLPIFYYSCGRIGHPKLRCPKPSGLNPDPFGMELRAGPQGPRNWLSHTTKKEDVEFWQS